MAQRTAVSHGEERERNWWSHYIRLAVEKLCVKRQ